VRSSPALTAHSEPHTPTHDVRRLFMGEKQSLWFVSPQWQKSAACASGACLPMVDMLICSGEPMLSKAYLPMKSMRPKPSWQSWLGLHSSEKELSASQKSYTSRIQSLPT